MTNTALNPTAVPGSPFYSQGIDIRDPAGLVFVSGQVGMTATGDVLEGIEAQAAQAVANLNAVLDEAGLTAANLAKRRCRRGQAHCPDVPDMSGNTSDAPPLSSEPTRSANGAAPGAPSPSRAAAGSLGSSALSFSPCPPGRSDPSGVPLEAASAGPTCPPVAAPASISLMNTAPLVLPPDWHIRGAGR
jgi:hypothetical protein